MNKSDYIIQKVNKLLSLRRAIVLSVILILGNILSRFILVVAAFYIIYLFCSQNDIENYYLGLFLIPNIRILDAFGVTYIVNLLLAVPLVIYVMRKNYKFDRTVLFGWLFLLIWEGFHIAVFENYSNLPNELSMFLGMLYCITITLNEYHELNCKNAWNFFAFGIIVSGISYLFSHPSYLNGMVANIVMGYRFSGYAGEPNYYSLYICLALSMIFTFKKYSIYNYCAMFILIIFGLMTASKMCVLLMLFTLIIGFIDCAKKIKYQSKKGFIIFGILMLIIGGVLFKNQIAVLAQNFIKRAGLSDNNLDFERITSGRSSIFSEYISILSNDFLGLIFGKGLQYHLFFNSGGYGSHNTYLDAVLAWGGIGFIVLISIIAYWRNNIISRLKVKKTFSIPILILGINFLDLSCLSATMFWWVLSLSFLSLYNNADFIEEQCTECSYC